MEDKIYKPQDNITNPYIKDFDEYKSMYEESILNNVNNLHTLN